MKDLKNLVPHIVRDELEKCGLPWSMEHDRHLKIRLDGRFAIAPKDGGNDGCWNSALNLRAQVRRAIREATG